MPRENTSLKCILISLSLLLLTGCGATSQTATSTQKTVTTPANTQAESKEKGYIYQSDNQAVFINWTEDNNNFVGQMQVTDLTDSGIQSSNHAFNGVLNGTNLSLTITGSILNDGWTGKVFRGCVMCPKANTELESEREYELKS